MHFVNVFWNIHVHRKCYLVQVADAFLKDCLLKMLFFSHGAGFAESITLLRSPCAGGRGKLCLRQSQAPSGLTGRSLKSMKTDGYIKHSSC